MEYLDINTFKLFKKDINTQELNIDLLNKLLIIFPDSDKKNKNKNKNNILKNQKIQIQKDNLFNKVNLILNKLSEKNIDNLVIEFIDNINQVSFESFKEIQKTFYLKIISEINFINVYIDFLKIIGLIYNKVQNYDLSYFYEIIECKFKIDYSNYELEPINNLSFINDIVGESNRLNNLILINHMVQYKLISNNIYDYCDNIILNQTIFLSDIYYWFNSKNKELTNNELLKINNIILNNKDISNRESILLKNLIKNVSYTKSNNNIDTKSEINIVSNIVSNIDTKSDINIVTKSEINIDTKSDINIESNIDTKSELKNKYNVTNVNTINLECIHIIDEYLMLKSIDDIKYFIDTRCIDTINKNKFCENLIHKYFISNKEISEEIIKLIKQLVKLHILFKSNYSRGLLLVYNNSDELSIDYDNSTQKIKILLSTLKALGITKGLENILEKYNI